MTLISTRDLPDGHPGWQFLLGRTPFFAARADQRFSYAMYIPTDYRTIAGPLPLLVAVHGTGRRAERTRELFVEFAEQHGVAVLAPLFPAGIDDPNDLHNYKLIEYRGIRFDDILIGMLDEVAERWNIDTGRFLLFGFSGGGQFTERFALLHPERMLGVAVGAPGRVTLPDDAPWPDGLGSHVLDLEALAAVPVQVLVGSDDLAGELLAAARTTDLEGRAGATRVERARTLATALEPLVASVELVEMPGVGHDQEATVPYITEFFGRVLGR